jgi:hypothetical protein
MKFHVWILLMVGVLLCCEEPNINTDRLDPAIRATFIDMDSIMSMEMNIDIINTQISAINDSLFVIDSLIDAGDQTDYDMIIESLETEKDELTEERTEVSVQLSEVSQGNILINRISATGADKDLLYEEARSIYRMPLNPRSTTTEFFILYNGSVNTAVFTYYTDTLLENRTVRIIARDVELPAFDYDSANFRCDTLDCTSENARVTFYF